MDSPPQASFPGYANVKVHWKLKNFSIEYFHNPLFYTFTSPLFRIGLSNYCAVKYKLIAMRNRNTLNIFLRKDVEDRCYTDYSSLQIHYEVKIKDYYLKQFKNRVSGKIDTFYYEHKLGKLLTMKELRGALPHFLNDKTIEICVLFRVMENKKNTTLAPSTVLSLQYEKMFNDKTYSDFTLVTSDDEEIFVHKNILSIRSPVFAAMVNTMLKEGEQNRAKIDDIQSRSLLELVRFIYSGRVNDINPIAKELLYAASKYDLQDLKPLCVKSLALNITCETALDILVLADLHGENDLKRFVMDFIKFNYEQLKDSENWKNLTQEQMKSTMDHLMNKDEEKANINLVTTITVQPRVQQIVPTAAAAQPNAQN